MRSIPVLVKVRHYTLQPPKIYFHTPNNNYFSFLSICSFASLFQGERELRTISIACQIVNVMSFFRSCNLILPNSEALQNLHEEFLCGSCFLIHQIKDAINAILVASVTFKKQRTRYETVIISWCIKFGNECIFCALKIRKGSCTFFWIQKKVVSECALTYIYHDNSLRNRAITCSNYKCKYFNALKTHAMTTVLKPAIKTYAKRFKTLHYSL